MNTAIVITAMICGTLILLALITASASGVDRDRDKGGKN